MTRSRVIMIYLEPTPYIVGLIDALREAWSGPVEVRYVATDFSQNWALDRKRDAESVLPAGRAAAFQAIWSTLLSDRKRIVLHLAGWGHPVLLGAMVMGRLLRVPVFVESDTVEGRASGGVRALLRRLLYPLLFRLPRHFLPGGTRQARYLEAFGVPRERMTVAQMTADVAAIRRFSREHREAARSVMRTRAAAADGDLVLLYLGRLEDYKGVLDLISAFMSVAQSDKSVRLMIVGDGPLRPTVEAAASGHPCIAYLGRLSGHDVWRAYLAADILVVPSRFEPWGLVVNEAMACGLPVIVSDRVGCVSDLVHNGETGLVVEAGSESALASAIRQLAGDASARKRMSDCAGQLISGWTLENEAENVVTAWREVLG